MGLEMAGMTDDDWVRKGIRLAEAKASMQPVRIRCSPEREKMLLGMMELSGGGHRDQVLFPKLHGIPFLVDPRLAEDVVEFDLPWMLDPLRMRFGGDTVVYALGGASGEF